MFLRRRKLDSIDRMRGGETSQLKAFERHSQLHVFGDAFEVGIDISRRLAHQDQIVQRLVGKPRRNDASMENWRVRLVVGDIAPRS